jgi:hypothetical protein
MGNMVRAVHGMGLRAYLHSLSRQDNCPPEWAEYVFDALVSSKSLKDNTPPKFTFSERLSATT